MNKSEFKNHVKIYKSHPLKNGFISVTYASILGRGAVSTESTIEIEKDGGALNSLYKHLVVQKIEKHAKEIGADADENFDHTAIFGQNIDREGNFYYNFNETE